MKDRHPVKVVLTDRSSVTIQRMLTSTPNKLLALTAQLELGAQQDKQFVSDVMPGMNVRAKESRSPALNTTIQTKAKKAALDAT